MIHRLLAITSLISVLLLEGCATPTSMAFSKDAGSASGKVKPVFLMTATLKNKYRTSHQPKLLVVNVEKDIVKGAADRINFTMDADAKNESDDPNIGSNYLLRMELEDGKYVLRGLTSVSFSFPIQGFFFAPIHENIEANGSGIFYLGHIDATVRKRNENEFKAGASIPLIDQAVAGASGGTFDIEISDRWNTDEALFRNKFPALAEVNITKAILPPFDRDRAQKWWEKN